VFLIIDPVSSLSSFGCLDLRAFSQCGANLSALVVYFRCLFALGAVQAAGGPQSDYAVVSLVRERGTVTVRNFFRVCVRLMTTLIAASRALRCNAGFGFSREWFRKGRRDSRQEVVLVDLGHEFVGINVFFAKKRWNHVAAEPREEPGQFVLHRVALCAHHHLFESDVDIHA